MARERKMVPFGYEAEKPIIKGTVFIMDSFAEVSAAKLEAILNQLEERAFAKVVMYPFHGETLKRMGIREETPYHKRVKTLEEILDRIVVNIPYTIDEWEGRRKKYTPLDTALSFLTEKFKGPYFVLCDCDTANLFAATPKFEEWIREIRLIMMDEEKCALHPKLLHFENRLERISLRF